MSSARALAALCVAAYLSIYAMRKSWTSAPFDDASVKVALASAQMLGYFSGKCATIGFVSSLSRAAVRTVLQLIAATSLAGWLIYAAVPAVALRCLAIACATAPQAMCWSLIYRYVEGRDASDVVAALLSTSLILGSGTAKMLGAAW